MFPKRLENGMKAFDKWVMLWKKKESNHSNEVCKNIIMYINGKVNWDISLPIDLKTRWDIKYCKLFKKTFIKYFLFWPSMSMNKFVTWTCTMYSRLKELFPISTKLEHTICAKWKQVLNSVIQSIDMGLNADRRFQLKMIKHAENSNSHILQYRSRWLIINFWKLSFGGTHVDIKSKLIKAWRWWQWVNRNLWPMKQFI